MGNATADASPSETTDAATADDPPAPRDRRQSSEPAAPPSSDADDAGVERMLGVPPPGTASDDARCGNGMLDETELCDIAIPDGMPGACPLHCQPADACHPVQLLLDGCFSRCIPLTTMNNCP